MSKYSVSDEERALFRQAVNAIKPQRATKQSPNHKAQELYLSDHYHHQPVDAETVLSYGIHGLDKRRISQLKNGGIAPEARLDLHGLRIDEASRKLVEFIESTKAQQKRCLLIIHGKGGQQNGRGPVLKNLVYQWLQQIPGILAFHSAKPKDGGNGALYVLLKRN